MKKLFTLSLALLLVPGVARAQTAVVTQTGDNQTASVTQTGSTSNEAYVTQLSDNTGAQVSTVLQTGLANYAWVSMTQIGGGGITPANTAFLQQVGDRNDMRQRSTAPGFNSGQSMSAEQRGDRNRGVQTVVRGYTLSLVLQQRGDRNDSEQLLDGPNNHGEVYQVGDLNLARQTLRDQNEGYSSGRILIDQRGDNNDAYQVAQGGGWSVKNHAEIDQNGANNYANQFGDGGAGGVGTEFFLRIRQDGNSNWARTSSTGDSNYLNARMSDGAYLLGTQMGEGNELMGLGGAGTEALVLNGSSLRLTQTGDLNDAFVRMMTGGTATVSQIGSSNTATVVQN